MSKNLNGKKSKPLGPGSDPAIRRADRALKANRKRQLLLHNRIQRDRRELEQLMAKDVSQVAELNALDDAWYAAHGGGPIILGPKTIVPRSGESNT